MQPVQRRSVKRIEKFLEDLRAKRPKLHHTIDLSSTAKLMNAIGFAGPLSKKGSIRGFSHELLESDPMLHQGKTTIHVVHGEESVTFKDFKQYVLPYIEKVLIELENKKLIREDEEDVQV